MLELWVTERRLVIFNFCFSFYVNALLSVLQFRIGFTDFLLLCCSFSEVLVLYSCLCAHGSVGLLFFGKLYCYTVGGSGRKCFFDASVLQFCVWLSVSVRVACSVNLQSSGTRV